ncbi:hypothetical protein NEOLEDRAFT_1120748 [Neolentinus lepideus HHB14362 ss-1]|uniref:N-acetyltransferase domain-containing protein n=1 Tax=Neolentinus lepideus HHB14362 ss-1 TaxID=1314782 RepID=A0A165Q1U2_9AGAM|nr:hypothetical protein NEOLEDRAFT_1120748 [Neolentinus lepideus HHB14362 ss-1]
MSENGIKPYVRLVKSSELDVLATIQRRAFIDDPECNYFGSVDQPLSDEVDSPGKQHLETFFRFLTKACLRCGARITVAVVPSSESAGEDSEEKICASTIWMPPNKRISLGSVWALVRSGVFATVKGWGLNGLIRVGVEYGEVSGRALKEAYATRGLKKQSPDSSWYLQLACTDPHEQGKGYMSLLCREAFAHAPSSIFTLEATTSHSRDRYTHFGFELFKEVRMGVNKVNKDGLPAKGKEAEGVPIYSMVKWE